MKHRAKTPDSLDSSIANRVQQGVTGVRTKYRTGLEQGWKRKGGVLEQGGILVLASSLTILEYEGEQCEVPVWNCRYTFHRARQANKSVRVVRVLPVYRTPREITEE